MKNASDQVVHEETNVYRALPWGEERVERILGPSLPANEQQKWTWEFYTDPNQIGLYGRLKTSVEPSGFWETYEYDADGRESKRVSQYLDVVLGSPESQCRVVTNIYSETNPRRTTVETLQSVETRRDYEAATGNTTDQIRCTQPDAAWDDPSNLVTSTTAISVGSYFNQPQSVRNPDGTAVLYDYQLNGADKTTTVSVGQPNGDLSAIIAGTRTVTVLNAAGGKLSETVTDISSGLLTSSATTTAVDGVGRPTAIQYLDGTSEAMNYACCGLEWRTERQGLTTTYTYTSAKQIESETRGGIALIYTYDPMGRKLSTVRRGNDQSEITLETLVYDVAGRIRTAQTPRGTSTLTEVIDGNGHTVKTSARPDAGVRIETYNQDKSLLSVSGSGAHPLEVPNTGWKPAARS